MYRVRCNGVTLYSSIYLNEAGNAHTDILDPILTIEDNSPGSFTFTLPKDHRSYSDNLPYSVKCIESEITIDRRAVQRGVWDTIWVGRPITEEVDFDGNKMFTCEGELSYLRDTRQPQRTFSEQIMPDKYFKSLLDTHNSKVKARKKFYVGTCEFLTWVDSDGVQTTDKGRITSFEDTLTLIKNLADELKGHLVVTRSGNKRYLNLYKNNGAFWPKATTQNPIRFGENLLDFTKKYEMSDLATVIIPLGARLDSTTNAEVGDVVFDQSIASARSYATCAILRDTTDEVPTINANADHQEGDSPTTNYNNYMLYGPYSLRYKNGELVDKYMFYTGRMNNGRCTYLIRNNEREILASSSGGSGISDTVEQKIEIPPGSTKMWIAGYGTDIPLRLNRFNPKAVDEYDDYVTIESVNNNSLYVINESLREKYDWIEKVVEFPSETNPSELLKKAKKYLRSDQFEDMTIEIKMIDRKYFNWQIPALNVGDKIRVISKPHGLDKWFPCTKQEIHLLDPDQSTYTLGYEHKTQLSVISSETQSSAFDKITATEKNTSVRLKEAQDKVSYMIASATGGYVTLRRDPNTNSVCELIISDIEDYMDSNARVWRWNIGGLGFSPTGYDENNFKANVALTASGEIVANRITTGTMSADRIEGGTLKLGGTNNQAGVFEVMSGRTADGSQTMLVSLDNTGLSFWNPFTGRESGVIRVGGVNIAQDGAPVYNSEGADDILLKSNHSMVISAKNNTGELYLLVPDTSSSDTDGGLFTGSSQGNAKRGVSIGFNIDNRRKLTFKNGLLVEYDDNWNGGS